MSARRLTRRSLLGASAGALAGGLTRPAGVLGALLAPPAPVLEGRRLGSLGPSPRTVELARRADLLGLQWSGPAHPGLQLRVRTIHGGWSAWIAAGAHGHGPDEVADTTLHTGDPIWTGGVSAVQLRSAEALHGVRLHLIDVSRGLGARREAALRGPLAGAASLPLAGPMLSAGPGQPAILARRAWAAGISHPRVAPGYGAVRMAFVHHTENPNGYSAGEVPAMLRAIYAFHRNVNGWNDIGYNFVIDRFGRIFEARAGGIAEPVVGAHAGGYNLVSTGVAMLGAFMGTPISSPSRRALERLLAWKLSLHGVSSSGRVRVRVNPAGAVYSRFPANARVSLPRIAGHRDADSTDCPGDVLYGELGAIRTGVALLAPRPPRLTLTLAPGPSAPGPMGTPQAPGATGTPQPPAGGEAPPAEEAPRVREPPPVEEAPGTQAPPPLLAGHLGLLDGTPLAGAPIQLQARRVSRRGEVVAEQTLATLTTDSRGAFALAASFPGISGRISLRALCTAAGTFGAVVSDPVTIVLSALPAAPLPSPPVAGPPPP